MWSFLKWTDSQITFCHSSSAVTDNCNPIRASEQLVAGRIGTAVTDGISGLRKRERPQLQDSAALCFPVPSPAVSVTLVLHCWRAEAPCGNSSRTAVTSSCWQWLCVGQCRWNTKLSENIFFSRVFHNFNLLRIYKVTWTTTKLTYSFSAVTHATWAAL